MRSVCWMTCSKCIKHGSPNHPREIARLRYLLSLWHQVFAECSLLRHQVIAALHRSFYDDNSAQRFARTLASCPGWSLHLRPSRYPANDTSTLAHKRSRKRTLKTVETNMKRFFLK